MSAETSRDLDARWDGMTLEEKKSALIERSRRAEPVLRERLRQGDKMRATAARCGAHEATFTFWGWEGRWIVSRSGVSISPSSVYSINGEIFRA